VAQHAQTGQRGDALAVGRDLVDVVAGERRADRAGPAVDLDEVPGVGQILQRQRAAGSARVLRDGLGSLAAVETLRAEPRQQSQRMRRTGQPEVLAHVGCAAARHEVLGKAGAVLQQRHCALPLLLHDRRHREAALGVVDGRRQHVGERLPSEP